MGNRPTVVQSWVWALSACRLPRAGTAGVVGYDLSAHRIAALRGGHDWTGDIADQKMAALDLTVTDDSEDLADATFIIVTVPAPIMPGPARVGRH
jgi:UDP-N-acetyl-D-mannosaminuronate dehydrogenase